MLLYYIIGTKSDVVYANSDYLVIDIKNSDVSIEKGSLILEYVDLYPATIANDEINLLIAGEKASIDNIVYKDTKFIVENKFIFIHTGENAYAWCNNMGCIMYGSSVSVLHVNPLRLTGVNADSKSFICSYDEFIKKVILEVGCECNSSKLLFLKIYP